MTPRQPDGPRSSEVVESNKRALVALASDPALWESWLEAVAEHPQESALNCASIQASPYADKSVLRTESAWTAAGFAILEGSEPIRLVHRERGGAFRVDLMYPPEALDKDWSGVIDTGRPKIDVSNPADLAIWTEVTSHVDITGLSVNAVHIVMARYGIPDDGRFEMPPERLLDDIDGLCDHCRAIRGQASSAIYALDRSIEKARSDHKDMAKRSEHARKSEQEAGKPAERDVLSRAAPSTPDLTKSGESEPTRIERIDLRNINPADMARIARKAASCAAGGRQQDGTPERRSS